MSNDRLNAAFLAELGSSNRDRLLAAPDTRDAALRGRARPNGPGRVPSQQLNGTGDSTVSGWQGKSLSMTYRILYYSSDG